MQRVVKRIMVIKRLTIIRQVNDVIEKVCVTNNTDSDTEENTISLKKLVKVLNMCHVFVPII